MGREWSNPQTQSAPEYVQDGPYGWQWQITPGILPSRDIDGIVEGVWEKPQQVANLEVKAAQSASVSRGLGDVLRPRRPARPAHPAHPAWSHRPMRPARPVQPQTGGPLPPIALDGLGFAPDRLRPNQQRARDGSYAKSLRRRHGMSGLGDIGMSNIEIAEAILDGSMSGKLRQMRTDNQINTGTLETLRQDIARMPEGSAKEAAQNQWQIASNTQLQASNDTNSAINRYNSVVEFIISQPVLFAGASPSHLGDLGNPVLVAGLVGAGVFLYFAADFFRAVSGQAASKGYIEQIADLVRSTGTTVTAIGGTFATVMDTAGKWALIAAVGMGAYYLVKNFSQVKSALGISR